MEQGNSPEQPKEINHTPIEIPAISQWDVLAELKKASEEKNNEVLQEEEKKAAKERDVLAELKKASEEKKAADLKKEEEEIENKRLEVAALKDKKEQMMGKIGKLTEQREKVKNLYGEYRATYDGVREQYEQMKKANKDLFKENEIDSVEKFLAIFEKDIRIAPILDTRQQKVDYLRGAQNEDGTRVESGEFGRAREIKSEVTEELGIIDKSSNDEILEKVAEENTETDKQIESIRREIPDELESLQSEHKGKIVSTLEVSFGKDLESQGLVSKVVSEMVALGSGDEIWKDSGRYESRLKSIFLQSEVGGVSFEDTQKFGPEVFNKAVNDFVVKKVKDTLQEKLIPDRERISTLEELYKFKKNARDTHRQARSEASKLVYENFDFLSDLLGSKKDVELRSKVETELFPLLPHMGFQESNASVMSYLKNFEESDGDILGLLSDSNRDIKTSSYSPDKNDYEALLINNNLMMDIGKDVNKYISEILIPSIKNKDIKVLTAIRKYSQFKHYNPSYNEPELLQILNIEDYPILGVSKSEPLSNSRLTGLIESRNDNYVIPGKIAKWMKEIARKEDRSKSSMNGILSDTEYGLERKIQGIEHSVVQIGKRSADEISSQISSKIFRETPEYKAAFNEKDKVERVNQGLQRNIQVLLDYIEDPNRREGASLLFQVKQDGSLDFLDKGLEEEARKIFTDYDKEPTGEPDEKVGKIVLQKSELKAATAKLNSLLEKQRGILGRFTVSKEEIEDLNKMILKSKQEIESLNNEKNWKYRDNSKRQDDFRKGQSLTRTLYHYIAQPQNYIPVDVTSRPSSLIEAARGQKLSVPDEVAKILSFEKQLSNLR